ncbi:integral membrane [Fusarium longipes]|uniref:Integral membrane n=1 Tax=Fusarium longipes TaxID=694270 RepID=A0A395TA18_9HYPO|nr:integral membrane [Fusarium longipes]
MSQGPPPGPPGGGVMPTGGPPTNVIGMFDDTPGTVDLEGFPLAITIVVLVFMVLAIMAVGVRIIVRSIDKNLGLDDWLLITGMLAYIADTGLAVYGTSVAFGSKDDKLNKWMHAEGQKIYIIWNSVYFVAVALIKTSVCVTLLRIANAAVPVLRYSIWALFCLIWASFLVTFFGIVTFCRPISAPWGPEIEGVDGATCGTTATLMGIAHTNTATSIVTDIACVVIPGILLWKTRMSTMAKIQVLCLLSLASLASIATIIRAPFISSYLHPSNNLKYYIGYIVLLSCVEVGIGCVAASLPCILLLYRRLRGQNTESSPSPRVGNTLITIGGGRVGEGSIKEPKRVFSTADRVFSNADRGTMSSHIHYGKQNWERLSDNGSHSNTLVEGSKGAFGQTDSTLSVELESYRNHKP